MVGYIITGIIGAVLIGITILLLTGRGANLIAGFNTLTKKEKEKYDKAALCKFVGKILIPTEIAIYTGVIGGILKAQWSALFTIIVGVMVLPYIIVVAIYANTGNRFIKKGSDL